MNRSETVSVVLVVLVVVLASGLVVFTMPKTEATTPTVTLIKQTVVETADVPICGTTEAIAYVPTTTTTETTIFPSSLPTEYPYIVTIVTASTVLTTQQPGWTIC